jgi:hypothetical protein
LLKTVYTETEKSSVQSQTWKRKFEDLFLLFYCFYTGVLNTEELAIINTTSRQTGKSSLAGIPEEVRRSGESTTTLDTDNWTLESLESELFDNVRASIKKTLGLSEKEPSSTSGSLQKNRKEGSNPSRLGCKSC